MAKSLLELYGVNYSLIGNKNYESAERNLLKIIPVSKKKAGDAG